MAYGISEDILKRILPPGWKIVYDSITHSYIVVNGIGEKLMIDFTSSPTELLATIQKILAGVPIESGEERNKKMPKQSDSYWNIPPIPPRPKMQPATKPRPPKFVLRIVPGSRFKSVP